MERSRVALYLAGVLSLFVFVYASVHFEIEPYWMLLAALVPVFAWILVRKFPVVLLIALVYVGNFKTHAAIGISPTDPTLIVVILLYAAIFIQLLVATTGFVGQNLRELFSGQWLGVIAFFLLILVIACSYTYSPAPRVGGDKVLKLVGFDVLAFVAPLVLLRNDRDIRQLVLLSIVSSLALACKTIYTVLHPSGDLLSGVRDPTQIGAGVLIGAAVLMILYFPLSINPIFRVLLMCSAIIFTIATVASVSRAAVLCLLMVVIASSLFLRLPRDLFIRKWMAISIVVVVVAASIAAIWLWHLPATHTKIAVKADELSAVLHGKIPSGTAAERYSYAGSAWQGFLAKPFLGWGAGGWSTLWHYTYERAIETYPHNFVLEVAAEQGLAGLTVLTLLLATIIRACISVTKESGGRDEFMFVVPVVALCFLCHLTSGSIEDRALWLWCGTLFACARMVGQPQLQVPSLPISGQYGIGQTVRC